MYAMTPGAGFSNYVNNTALAQWQNQQGFGEPGAMGATASPTQASSWENLGLTPQGSQFLANRASTMSTFSRDANGNVVWNTPGQTQQPGMTSTPGPTGMSNPYLGAQADAIRQQMEQMLGNSFAGIQSNAVGVGGLGGTRQGVAQGQAAGMAAQGLTGALAGLYGGAYNSDQNRSLQRYGMDQNFNLGLGGLDNQRYGMDQNFYTAQRGLDQSGAALGGNLWNMGVNGSWGPINNATNTVAPFSGNGTTVTNTSSGGGLTGAIGGGLGMAQMGRNFGWW